MQRPGARSEVALPVLLLQLPAEPQKAEEPTAELWLPGPPQLQVLSDSLEPDTALPLPVFRILHISLFSRQELEFSGLLWDVFRLSRLSGKWETMERCVQQLKFREIPCG